MKIEIEKDTVQKLACIAQIVSTLGNGMKISRELEDESRKALDKLNFECPTWDLN